MTDQIFGKGDLVALPRLGVASVAFGADTFYTEPSYDFCYSHHGFAVPLLAEAMPFDLLMDDLIPPPAKNTVRFEQALSYFLIDHGGHCWNVTIPDMQGKITFNFGYIETKRNPGWWITQSMGSKESVKFERLTGLLVTNPERKVIEDYLFRYQMGDAVEWFKISDIVTKLNQDYPKPVGDSS